MLIALNLCMRTVPDECVRASVQLYLQDTLVLAKEVRNMLRCLGSGLSPPLGIY